MCDPDGREIMRAQERERPENILMLLRFREIYFRQSWHEKINYPLCLDVGYPECRLDLGFHVQSPCNASQNSFILPSAIRHFLEQGRKETESSAFPEIGKPDHIQKHEPTRRRPDLPAQVSNQMSLANTRRANQNATDRFQTRVLGLPQKISNDGILKVVIGPGRKCCISTPDALERLDPGKVDIAECFEFGGHASIHRT